MFKTFNFFPSSFNLFFYSNNWINLESRIAKRTTCGINSSFKALIKIE